MVALVVLSRVPLDLETIKTILGYQRRPRYRQRKSKSAQWDVAVEKPTYDLTILKLHGGKLTLKIYTKGERVLRIEVVVHNTQELQCGRSLEKFPQIRTLACAQFLERADSAETNAKDDYTGNVSHSLSACSLPSEVHQERLPACFRRQLHS